MTNAQTEGAAQSVRPPSGDLMLNTIHDLIRKYVALPNPHAAVVITLWIVHTWCVMAFFTTPRLIIESPEPGSGKSRLLEVLALLSYNGKVLLNTSVAALYRRISAAEHPPTVLQDEYDAVFGPKAAPSSEDLRALYNGGYRRGATVDRCEGDSTKMKVVEFKVFAAVAMAGIGSAPRTISTRGVTIPMRKRAPGETITPYRERDALDEAAPIREALKAWAAHHFDDLAAARPDLPGGVVDRPAEVWEPLLAIADQCGGRWPELARAACKHFVFSRTDETASVGVRLLTDIYALFHNTGDTAEALTAMHSHDIVTALTSDEDSPWRDLWGKQLDQRRLAAELKKYGVRAKQVRIGDKSSKGYLVAPHTSSDGNSSGLSDAWQRYLPLDRGNNRNKGNNAGQPVSDDDPVSDANETTLTSETFSDPLTSGVSDVSLVSDVEGTGAPTPLSMPVRGSHPALIPSTRRRRIRTKQRCACGVDLERAESIQRGQCAECALASKQATA